MTLEVKIKKRLGNFWLDVEFVSDNGVLALFGASGSGKSMMLKCIAGIETADEGRIVLDGKTLFDSIKKINLSPQKRSVGYLFQDYALFTNMTAKQNIYCVVKGNREFRKKTVDKFIESLYLAGFENKYPHQLSGGQKQRVALARILASSPKIILLDEPFSALDSYLQWQVEAELSDILAKFDGLTLFVSHNKDEVYRICDNVCVINEGYSEQVVSVAELFENPKTIAAALLSGCRNYSRAKKIGKNIVYAEDWGTQLVTNKPVSSDICFIGIRSLDIKPFAKADENIIDCYVVCVIPEIFGCTVIIKPERAKENSAYTNLRIDTKENFKNLNISDKCQIFINPTDILTLENSHHRP